MSQVMPWIQANFLWLWPLVSAVASVLYKFLDEDTPLHSVLSLLASAGLDLPKLLSMLAKLMGGGSSGKPPSANVKTPIVAATMLLVGCGLFGSVTPPATDCGTRILNDAAKGMTLVQIEADVAGPCSADLAAIIAAILNSTDAAVINSQAHDEAVKIKAAVKN